jgi:DNA-binding response OmpR family regulator
MATSRFKLEVSITRLASLPEQTVGTTEPAMQLDSTQADRSPFSLLITDDDDSFREALRGIFETEGFRTLLAHSGEEALDILHDEPVHVALLDQHLPRLTGLETLRIIRQQMNVILPVILLTADRTQQLLHDALSAQAFCVMPKPVSRNVVVYTVQRALARSYPGRDVTERVERQP